MTESNNVERLKEHANAFGLLRLIFAALVIVSHTVVLADGNDKREPLAEMFGDITFGDLAVSGFFLISGYLIVGSFVKRPKVLPYLFRRVIRIYPAFIVASLICLFIVAPLGGVLITDIFRRLAGHLVNIVQLQMPFVDNAFYGRPYPLLDGSMWTIRYEFLCYLLVIPLGLAGVFKKPIIVAVMSIALLSLFSIMTYNTQLDIDHHLKIVDKIPHSANHIIQLVSIFFSGSLFYLYKEKINFTKIGAVFAVFGLCISLFFAPITNVGVALLGGYLTFAIASWGGAGIMARINNRDDISYGVYLYAWPAEKLLLWYFPDTPLLVAGIFTLIVSCLCGWISWHALEKPAMALLLAKRDGKPS